MRHTDGPNGIECDPPVPPRVPLLAAYMYHRRRRNQNPATLAPPVVDIQVSDDTLLLERRQGRRRTSQLQSEHAVVEWWVQIHYLFASLERIHVYHNCVNQRLSKNAVQTHRLVHIIRNSAWRTAVVVHNHR